MSTILTNNVVSRVAIPATPMPIVYDDWKKVPNGLSARGRWLGDGRGIRKDEKPKAFIELDQGEIGLYDFRQTYLQREPTRSKNILIDFFVRRNESFGLRLHGTDRIIRRQTDRLYGSVARLVYGSFNYGRRHTGVRLGCHYEQPIFADCFHILSPPETQYFVIDADNHSPTKDSTEAHLLLVQRLVRVIPMIVERLGVGSVFYDYSQFSPRGIHVWMTLNRKWGVKALHARVRDTLQRFADPALDATLKKHGLKPMGSLEILPTQTQTIRMFGTYDRRVFTTTELAPKNEAFDAEALLRHIRSKMTNGNPCARYAQLAIAGLGNDLCEAPSSVAMPTAMQVLGSTKPTQKSDYISYLVDACLNGIREADVLYQDYIVPIAQALYFRDFVDQPDRERLVEDAVLRWIDRKNHGLVTRITEGKRKEVVALVRHVVRRLPRTPEAIRSFWEKVVANDQMYPRQRISLVSCIDAEMENPVEVTRKTLKTLPILRRIRTSTDGEETKQDTYNRRKEGGVSASSPASLPPALETRLRDHLQRARVRKGICQERVVDFALRLLTEIGQEGSRTIGHVRINKLAGLGKGRTNSGRYKRLLVGAGILEPGYGKTWSKTRRRASRYRLTPWALGEVRKHWSPSPQP